MRNDTVQSVNRAIDIIECFAQIKKEWNLIELSEKIDLAPSTTHRLLNTLIQRRLIEQEGKSGKYRIGSRLLLIAGSVVNNSNLKTLAHPLLLELSNQTSETVHLSILSGEDVFYLDKLESPKSISIRSRIGQTLPAHVSGVGKVLLAYLPEEQQNELLQKVELKQFTPKSITDKEKLKAHFKLIKEQGFAMDNEELEEGLICFAAPVFNLDRQQVTAAISVSGPIYRLGEQADAITRLLISTANSLSNLLTLS